MSFSIKRKHLVFAGLAVSLAAAMYVNWYYTRPTYQKPDTGQETQSYSETNLGDAQFVNATVSEDYFASAQLNRTKAQEEAKLNLEDIISNPENDEESRRIAGQSLEKLNESMIKQVEIENFIKAKSGGEALVCLSSTAEVILERGTLSDELCIQIKDIITRKTDISAEKITIIEAK